MGFPLDTAPNRAKFIEKHGTYLCTATNVNGEEVVIESDNDGMTIKTRHKTKLQWLECIEYDEHGGQAAITYEHSPQKTFHRNLKLVQWIERVY